MNNAVLILGESGTGKSSSLRNLDPSSTFILGTVAKPLPWRGWRKQYRELSSDGMQGNLYRTDDPDKIIRTIKHVDVRRPEIKTLILDDFGYMMINSFMRKALVKGYDKFSEIGKACNDVFDAIQDVREDLWIIVIMHTEIDKNGTYKPKTVGSMVDQHVVIEGKFTLVFHALASEGRYKFLTNNDGKHMAKTPMGLYEEQYIDNDLSKILDDIKKYEEDE